MRYGAVDDASKDIVPVRREIVAPDEFTARLTTRQRILIVPGIPDGRIVSETIEGGAGRFTLYAMSERTYHDACSRALDYTGSDPRRNGEWPVERMMHRPDGPEIHIPVQQDGGYAEWRVRL